MSEHIPTPSSSKDQETSQIDVIKWNYAKARAERREVENFIESCKHDYIPTNFESVEAGQKVMDALEKLFKDVSEYEENLFRTYNAIK